MAEQTETKSITGESTEGNGETTTTVIIAGLANLAIAASKTWSR